MSDFYSKRNPLGPYKHRTRPDGNGGEYIEGQSTKANLKQWAEYAAKNSGPKVSPGLGKKPKAPTKSDASLAGWAPERSGD